MRFRLCLPSAQPQRARGVEERLHLERLIAAVRLILSPLTLAVVVLDPAAGRRGPLVGLLTIYTVVALLVMIATRAWTQFVLQWHPALHVADVAFVSAAAILLHSAIGPIWLLWFFVLIAAAERWGITATLASGAALVALGTGGRHLMRVFGLAAGGVGLLLPALLLSGGTVMVALLTGTQAALARETQLVARILVRVRRGQRVSDILKYALEEYRQFVGASAVVLAAEDLHSGALYEERAGSIALRSDEADSSPPAVERHTYFAELPRGIVAWRTVKPVGRAPRARGLGISGVIRPLQDSAAHDAILDAHRARSFVALDLALPRWRVRVFAFDPARLADDDLRLIHRLGTQVAPALYDRYLVAQLRNSAGAVERARISRNLHDTLIQSLIGLEMEVATLRRRPDYPTPAELEDIRVRLHDAIIDTRDLMTDLRFPNGQPPQLLTAVRAIVDRFRQETQIPTRLLLEVDHLDTTPRHVAEIAGIVREALVNVRKHADARHVAVRIGEDGNRWLLVVDDDGRGFGFEGQRTLAELDREPRGLVVIQERVRTIGGDLVVQSQPGRGARLEVRWDRQPPTASLW